MYRNERSKGNKYSMRPKKRPKGMTKGNIKANYRYMEVFCEHMKN